MSSFISGQTCRVATNKHVDNKVIMAYSHGFHKHGKGAFRRVNQGEICLMIGPDDDKDYVKVMLKDGIWFVKYISYYYYDWNTPTPVEEVIFEPCC